MLGRLRQMIPLCIPTVASQARSLICHLRKVITTSESCANDSSSFLSSRDAAAFITQSEYESLWDYLYKLTMDLCVSLS
jgi:hypothetical protein